MIIPAAARWISIGVGAVLGTGYWADTLENQGGGVMKIAGSVRRLQDFTG